MRKIPTLFVRDPENRANVTDEVTKGCEWVLAGEGKATRKYDGTCTMLDEDGKWWARREVKPGKAAPENYVIDNVDEVTGKTQGWEPIEQSSFLKFHEEGWTHTRPVWPGTYELIGPKINGNPEKVYRHMLIAHANAETFRFPSNEIGIIKWYICRLGTPGWEGISAWEGIVWHHPDGRMAKLKGKDLKGWTE